MILGHAHSRNDRHHLPHMAKRSFAATRVMVLYASGWDPAADKSLNSRDGEQAVLDAVVERLAPVLVGA